MATDAIRSCVESLLRDGLSLPLAEAHEPGREVSTMMLASARCN